MLKTSDNDDAFDSAIYAVLAHQNTSSFSDFQQIYNASYVDAMEYILLSSMRNKELAEGRK